MKHDDNPNEIINYLAKSVPVPITLISTRDCFVYDLYVKETILDLGPKKHKVIKKEFFFKPGHVPPNYSKVTGISEDQLSDIENLRVGVTTYENFFSHKQLKDLEKRIEATEKKSLNSKDDEL